MPLVLVDIGNSAIKLNWVSGEVADSVNSPLDATCQSIRINDWSEFDFGQLPKATCYWVTACVAPAKLHELSDALDQARRDSDRIRSVDHRLINLEIDVDQPEAVGIDRLVGCLAVAQDLADNEAAIVVDAGTAVTIDLVTGKGVFRGGVIYPGADASFAQLNQQTAALPRLDYLSRKAIIAAWQEEAKPLTDGQSLPPWQRNTTMAIAAGVYRTQLVGLADTVTRFRESLSETQACNCRIVLTGGGIDELLSVADILNCQPNWINEADVVPNLIHMGLLSIHHQNNKT